jgi:hypothetical protein
MPREYALWLAPFLGTIAGVCVIAFAVPELRVPSALAALFPVALVTYSLTAFVCVPVIFIAARFGLFSPALVYLTAILCAVSFAVWAFVIEPFAPFGIAAFVVGAVTALSFNAIFFRRIAL